MTNETVRRALLDIEEKLMVEIEPYKGNCPSCGSDKLHYRFIQQENGAVQVRIVCDECYHSHALPHMENIKKRTNTPLQNWSIQVRKRDNGKCVICGSQEHLEAHHIIPVAHDKAMMYLQSNGITLCRECHWKVHHPSKEEAAEAWNRRARRSNE